MKGLITIVAVSGGILTAVHWNEPAKLIGSYIGLAVLIGVGFGKLIVHSWTKNGS